MAGVAQGNPPRMSVESFRRFLESRPEKVRWELIDGVAVRLERPTLGHQRVASNLERLLLDALAAHAPHLTAYQRLGVNLAPAVEHYDPEPDVVVIDAEIGSDVDERYADRFYLAAEVVSSSDRALVDAKREIYQQHEACTCILTVQQDRIEGGGVGSRRQGRR